MNLQTNVLYYGDNLDILRHHIPDECVDLIYLDPPFNSNRSYNVLFRERSGDASDAQLDAFEDTWQWGLQAEQAYSEVVTGTHGNTGDLLRAMRQFLGQNDVVAYLTMMAQRMLELHRILKPNGSIYLHCDSTASHYLKLLMDSVFGPRNYRNEIIWKRTSGHSDSRQGSRHYGRITDTILFYVKGEENTWNVQYTPYDEDYVARDYRRVDESGRRYRIDNLQGPGGAAKGNPYYEVMGVSRHWRYSKERMDELIREGRVVQTRPGAVPQYKRYLDEMPGVPIQNLWADLPLLNNRSREALGYPTQKPLALLERIIGVSSNPGDVVLDPFCGCGTAVHAAEKLGRQWIGIDITHLAINVMRRRMQDAFPGIDIEVIGEPKDLSGARDLAAQDKYQFQWWALDRIDAQPVAGKKKGMDRGIDGVLPYFAGPKEDYRRALVSVKGGEQIGPAMIRDLKGVLEREGEHIGIFLTLRAPTQEMRTEAATAGFWHSDFWDRSYPRIQILTVEDVLNGKRPDIPAKQRAYAEAPLEHERGEQRGLTL